MNVQRAATKRDILLLSEQYLPVKGGHVVWLHEVSKRLEGVRVLTGRVRGLPRRESIEGVNVRRINLSRSWLLRPESAVLYANLFAQGAKEIMRNRPSVILAARALPEGLVAGALGRAFRVPSLVLAHGEEISPWTPSAPVPARRRITAVAKGWALWHTYREISMTVANSHFTRNLLIEGGISESAIAIVHPGTDPEQYRPMSRDEALAVQMGVGGKKVILTVGRLMWRKGQDMVLQAMPEILRAVPDVVYVIAGTGPYESGLRELAATLDVDSHVRFLGEVPFSLLPALYNLADVFVMPNRVSPRTRDLEGFGIVFLEANACGVPVVGGRSGGVPDAVADGETGLLVDGESPAEIAHAIIRLLKDPVLAGQMGRSGRERVCRTFTWSQSAEKVGALVARVAGRPSSRPGVR